MKKVFIGLLAFAAIAMTGCQNEINEGIEANKEGFKVFSGEIEQAEAENRTTLNEQGQVIWSGEEQINVFAEGASYNYTVASGKDTEEVTFDVVENGVGVPAEFEGTHYAVYPYSANHSVDAEGVFTLDMSGLAVQNAPAVDTYAHGAGYAIAQSNSTEFFFQNVLAAMDVEFSLEGNEFAEMITINKITVTSAEGYSLTGTATAKVGEAAVITANGGNQIVYTVEGATIDAATKYNCIIMVPAVEKAAFTGLTLKVEGENAHTGAPYFWEGTVPANAVKFERNKVTYLKKQIKPIEVEQVFVSNFEQLQAAVDALTTTEQVIINLAEGQYVGALDVTGGKNIVLQPAKEGDEVVLAGLDHQSNGPTPSTVVVNNITIDNTIEIEGWYTGTSQNIKPCVGLWGGNITFNECVFTVSGASGAETGIMSWWTINPVNVTLNNCTFNGLNNSARAAQFYGNVNVTATECEFNTAKEYAIKLALGEGYEAELTNNTVNNAQIFVRLGSAPYAGNNYKVTFTNNTLASGIALYDVDNYENQTVVEGAETKFYAADTEGIRSYLNGAASPANIYLGAKAYTMATNYSLAFEGTVNLFGAGMAQTTLSFNSTPGSADGGLNAYADGASLYFKDMKVVSPNTGSSYTGGFGRAANVKFDSCHYVGQWRNMSPVQFVGCTIDPQTSYIYTDYHDATFDNCTFNASEGKAIQVYNDGNTTETTITINKTTFTAAKQATTWDGKPVTAIDINSNGEKFTVNITESSATGFGTGLQSGNDFWNIKGGEANVTINIDGEKVWPVEKSAVQTLNEQIAAGESTITLTEDVVFEEGEVLTIPAGSEVTIDLGGKTMSAVNAGTTTTNNMIENKGNLTLTNGTIDYKDATVMTAAVNYASNTIDNASGATLTIEEGVVIENNSDDSVATYGYPHCINNAGTLVINGGTFTNNTDYSVMRIWCTEDDDTNVTINGGTFNGCIDFQTPNAKGNKGTLTITGGTFNGDTYTNSAVRLLGFGTDVDEMVSEISGGTFNKQIKISNYVGGEMNAQVFFVSGGKFNVEPTGFLAENCVTYFDGEYYVAAPMADAMQATSEIRVSNEIDLAKVSLTGYTGTITGVGEAAALSTRNFTPSSNEAYWVNGDITFKNLDILLPTGGDWLQSGFATDNTLVFDNCDFEGQATLNSHGTGNYTFNECDFVSTVSGMYASFVYGVEKATFNTCSFSGVDRAAKVYGTGGDLDVVYDNCTFTSTNTNKAGINIDATYATTTVAINNGCSQTNMNGLYAVEGTKATVTIDGKKVIGTLKLQPSSEWKEANARFAAYYYGNGDKWLDMTDDNNDGIYEVYQLEGYTSVVFCRMNPETTENNWNDGTKWSQTQDMTIISNETCHIAGWNTGVWASEYNTDTVYLNCNINGDWKGKNHYAVWTWTGSNAGTWKNMSTTTNKSGLYTIAASDLQSNIIFVAMNNATNDWNNKAQQTGDLVKPTTKANIFDMNASWVTPAGL